MKKMMFLLSIAAAALTAWSCTKENNVKPVAKGTPITVEVGFPEFNGDENDPDSKMSSNGIGTDGKYKFKFDAGDSFHVFSFTDYTDNTAFTDWGVFTTEAGGAYARFTGYVPDDYSATTHGGKFTVLHHEINNNIELTWANNRYEYRFNIPDHQDGTGLKYALFGSPATGTSAPSFTPASEMASGNPRLGLQFRCYSCLCVINLTGGDVRTIKVTVDHKKVHTYNLVSNGEAKDIVYNCGGNALSGGGSKTLTINNNDQVLSGDIFFVTRQTNGSASNGYAYLTFEFINGEGKTCTKVVNLATNIDATAGTAGTYKNLSQYNTISNFGTLDLTSATFE